MSELNDKEKQLQDLLNKLQEGITTSVPINISDPILNDEKVKKYIEDHSREIEKLKLYNKQIKIIVIQLALAIAAYASGGSSMAIIAIINKLIQTMNEKEIENESK